MSTKSLLLTTAFAFGIAFSGTSVFATSEHHHHHKGEMHKECCVDKDGKKIHGVKDEKECMQKEGTWKTMDETHAEMHQEKHEEKK